MKKSGSAVAIVILVVILVLFVGFSVMPFMLLGRFSGGELAKATGGADSCIFKNERVSDTSLTTEIIISKLNESPSYKDRIDELGQGIFRQKIDEIVNKGKEKGINPIIPIAIWWGEQSFRNPEKAFGCAFRDEDTPENRELRERFRDWDAQLRCVFNVIQKAISSTQPYDKPPGADIVTRLFYTYATAMSLQYDSSGGQWLRSYRHPEHGNPYFNRINLIIHVDSSLVDCVDEQSQGVPSDGYACPMEERYANNASWGEIVTRRNYRVGTYRGHEGLDIFSPVGARVFSVSDGEVVKINEGDTDSQSDNAITIKEKPDVYWYYTHLEPNIPLNVGDRVRKGQLIGTVGKYIKDDGGVAHHLHLAISKRPDNRPTLGGEYNWDAWYYPYPFLKGIECLRPPAPEAVGYQPR